MAAPSSTNPHTTNSAAYAAALTKSDETTFVPTRAIYIGGYGDLAVKMAGDGASVTYKNVPAGTTKYVSITQLLSTGTTATEVIAEW